MHNYYKNNKFLFVSFFILFLLFLISVVISDRIVFGDSSCEFFKEMILYEDSLQDIIFSYNDAVVRLFSYKVHRLFFYLFFSLFDNLYSLSKLYSFSLATVPFLLLVFNFFISQRTKRYDIFVWSLVFYSFFQLPYLSHLSREFHISPMVYFLFLSYFLSEEPLKKIDKFFIVIFSLFLFESSETVVLLGLIFFFFGLLYYRKDRLQIKKILMGTSALFSSIYTLAKTIFNSSSDYIMNFENSIPRWFHSYSLLFDSTISSCMLFTVFGFLLLCALLFIKRDLNKKDLIWGIPYMVFAFILVFSITKFIPDPNKEANLFLFSMFVPILFFPVIIFLDYKKIKIHNYYYSNIFKVALIVGILYFTWQLNSSFYCFQYAKNIEQYMKTTDKMVSSYRYDVNSCGYSFESNICTMFRSIILQKDYKVKKLLIVDPNFRDYNGNENYGTYYDEGTHKVYINNCPLSVKNKYWDLTEISPIIKEGI